MNGVFNMTKISLTAVAFAALIAAPLAAQVAVDADGNGSFSLEELQAAFPDLSAEALPRSTPMKMAPLIS
jgi:opacity protein-like surface antigen